MIFAVWLQAARCVASHSDPPKHRPQVSFLPMACSFRLESTERARKTFRIKDRPARTIQGCSSWNYWHSGVGQWVEERYIQSFEKGPGPILISKRPRGLITKKARWDGGPPSGLRKPLFRWCDKLWRQIFGAAVGGPPNLRAPPSRNIKFRSTNSLLRPDFT